MRNVASAKAQVNLFIKKFIAQRPYRCSWSDSEEIKSQIKQYLIEESVSPYATPITFVLKNSKKKRT